MWITVNPRNERPDIVEAAMALSGKYKGTCSEFCAVVDSPEEIANLYNNADALGVDIYTSARISGFEEDEEW